MVDDADHGSAGKSWEMFEELRLVVLSDPTPLGSPHVRKRASHSQHGYQDCLPLA